MEYRLFTGEPSTSVFWHMLQHVVNHATFHRGQVTTMLRQLGGAPPKSQDLITYYRDRERSNPHQSEDAKVREFVFFEKFSCTA